MRPEDIPTGLALCRAAGWNQMAEDWALFRDLNPAGAHVAVHGDQVVGTVTAVDYGHRVSWIGMVLVNARYRQQGIGTRLLALAMESLGMCETVKLDATPQGRPVYLPLGFVDEYPLLRLETVAGGAYDAPRAATVAPLTSGDLPQVAAWDAEVFGADRSQVLRTYLGFAPAYAVLARVGTELAGYALGRHGFSNDQVGPVVARDPALAQALLGAVLARHPGRRFQVDVPLHSPEWLGWLRQQGFREQRPYTRMLRGPNRFPGLPGQQYAILGPELG